MRHGRGEFSPSVLAEFGWSGSVAVFVRLEVDDGTAATFVPRIATMERLGSPEGAGAPDGAQMVTDDDAVGRSESHDGIGVLFQIA